MGFSLAWAAVQAGRDAVLEQLGLGDTGQREDFTESEITGAALPGGWYLVIAQHNCLNFNNQEIIGGLSTRGEVIAGIVEEHVMLSALSYWREGACHWFVMHDSSHGIFHLDTVGPLPEEFENIRDRLLAEQEAEGGESADVDYIFDVPVELGRVLTGYRYDRDVEGLEEPGFEILTKL